jgi:hypothetical protein
LTGYFYRFNKFDDEKANWRWDDLVVRSGYRLMTIGFRIIDFRASTFLSEEETLSAKIKIRDLKLITIVAHKCIEIFGYLSLSAKMPSSNSPILHT